MPKLLSTPPDQAHTPVRDGGDACPGALRLHSADDGALARVRVPAGALTAGQLRALADAADSLGDGRIDITSRGNLQLRGLAEGCGGQLGAVLESSGLLPSPRHERVRNIVASPLSGLDGRGNGDVRAWVPELDGLLCGSEAATGLSGRFLFALDDGRGDVAALGADVTLVALPGGEALLRVGGETQAVRIGAGEAPRAALRAAEMFLTIARESGSRAWRVRELPAPQHSFAYRLTEETGIITQFTDIPGHSVPEPGCVEGPGGAHALSVLAPLGRLATPQWRLLAAAAGDGADELRVTPWRGVVVPGLSPAAARERMRELHAAGLITGPASAWLGVGACTGLPGCAKSHRDVRADAEAALGEGAGGLPVYFSGCERRCGHPQGVYVDVVADSSGYTVAVRSAQQVARPERAGHSDLAGAVASARATSATT